jgi:5-methylcytosine-specific restriction endonuclease McrA
LILLSLKQADFNFFSSNMGDVNGYRPGKRKRRYIADITNELSKRLAEAIAVPESCNEPPHLVDVLGTAHDQCIYCGRNELAKTNIDELIPPTQGGTMRSINRVPCCGNCNSSKSDKTLQDMELWLVTRGAHETDQDYYIEGERAWVIAQYIDTYRKDLCFTGTKLHTFRLGLEQLTGMYRRVSEEVIRFLECVSALDG